MELTDKDLDTLFNQCGGGRHGEYIEVNLYMKSVFQNKGCFEVKDAFNVLRKDLITLNNCRMSLCWSYICAGVKQGELEVIKSIDSELYNACKLVITYESAVENFGKKRVDTFIRSCMSAVEKLFS